MKPLIEKKVCDVNKNEYILQLGLIEENGLYCVRYKDIGLSYFFRSFVGARKMFLGEQAGAIDGNYYAAQINHLPYFVFTDGILNGVEKWRAPFEVEAKRLEDKVNVGVYIQHIKYCFAKEFPEEKIAHIRLSNKYPVEEGEWCRGFIVYYRPEYYPIRK